MTLRLCLDCLSLACLSFDRTMRRSSRSRSTTSTCRRCSSSMHSASSASRRSRHRAMRPAATSRRSPPHPRARRSDRRSRGERHRLHPETTEHITRERRAAMHRCIHARIFIYQKTSSRHRYDGGASRRLRTARHTRRDGERTTRITVIFQQHTHVYFITSHIRTCSARAAMIARRRAHEKRCATTSGAISEDERL
jgi:hypothetical protein